MLCRGIEGAECSVDGECEQEREQRVWNEDAREEEDAGGGEGEKASVEACTLGKCAASPGVAEEREAKDGEREWKMDREGVFAEDAKADGGDPVGERRFFEVADTVDVECDPVAGVKHGLRGLCVRGVGVVEQRGCSGGGEEDCGPEREKKDDAAKRPRLESRCGACALDIEDGARGSLGDDGAEVRSCRERFSVECRD